MGRPDVAVCWCYMKVPGCTESVSARVNYLTFMPKTKIIHTNYVFSNPHIIN